MSHQQFLCVGYTAHKATLAFDLISKVQEIKFTLENESKKKKKHRIEYVKPVRTASVSNIVRN